ncbi:zinc finger and BTB domain-containing protein 20-like isoform X8 [Lineus longissimus]|uniref:zinc finger and BTB domain-containing protein 20-like isoform X8 n=1 Tax=Lineus longissimus TaxID=88925 RepID=UPI00315D2FFF
MKDGAMSLQDNQHTDDEGSPSPGQAMQAEQPFQEMQTEHPFQNMQTELQSKGAVLTKAWSDLFSFITRYQAELVVKENSVEIAGKEINMRKRQLDEMKPVVDAGNEEITKLQEEIKANQRLLNRTQSELTVKEQMLQSVRSDLNCNMDMLDKSRSELLGKQTEVVRYRADLERLKSELTIKQEQISIKDHLLKKLQNQLMKENAELKEQLELKERTLEMERRAHEFTKRSLRQSKSKSSNVAAQPVIEIPDSPPTLDLSVEQADFGLSNIISMAESQSKSAQPMEQDVGSSQFRLSHPNQDNAISRISAMTTDTFSDLSHRMLSQGNTSMSATPTKEQWSSVSPSITSPMQSLSHDNFNPVSSASDTFFPLSVSQDDEDNKSGIDTSAGAMMMDSQRDSGMMPGTPSSGASDSNQGPPVPISGPIPSTGMSPGGDGKTAFFGPGHVSVRWDMTASRSSLRCQICGKTSQNKTNYEAHFRSHIGEKPFSCKKCHKSFTTKGSLKLHLFLHTGEKPFVCGTCGKKFRRKDHLSIHQFVHMKGAGGNFV